MNRDPYAHFAAILAVGQDVRTKIERRRHEAQRTLDRVAGTFRLGTIFAASFEETKAATDLYALDAIEDELVRLFTAWLDDTSVGEELDARVRTYLSTCKELSC